MGLIGTFMSLLFGVSGSTILSDIHAAIDGPDSTALISLGIVLAIVVLLVVAGILFR